MVEEDFVNEVIRVMDAHEALLDELSEMNFSDKDVDAVFQAAIADDILAYLDKNVVVVEETGLRWYLKEKVTPANKMLKKGEHSVAANKFYKALSGSDMDSKQLKHVWKHSEKKSAKYPVRAPKPVEKGAPEPKREMSKALFKENARSRALASALLTAKR